MTQTRIVETTDGRFMPQFRGGRFSRWAFLQPDADKSKYPAPIWIRQADPAKAAQFPTLEEAHAFVQRFGNNLNACIRAESAAAGRARDGVAVKRVIR